MNTDFKDIMSKKTDEELIKIVTLDREHYQPVAVADAEEEIKKRNIDITRIEQVKTTLTANLEEQKTLDSKKVGSQTRLIHFFVDTIVFFAIAMALTFILGLFFNASTDALMAILSYVTLITAFFGYYIFMETRYQKTIGKFITKTIVVNKDGTNPGIGDITRRTFCRLIPFDRFSFLFTSNGFHDRLSDTTIILRNLIRLFNYCRVR